MFPGGLDGKELISNARDLGFTPELGRCPGEGNGNPLQDSCLENPMDSGAWRSAVPGVTESDTTDHAHTCESIQMLSLNIRMMWSESYMTRRTYHNIT